MSIPCTSTCISHSCHRNPKECESERLPSCKPHPLANLGCLRQMLQHPPLSSWGGVARRLCSISLTYFLACSSEQKCFPNRVKSWLLSSLTPQTSQYLLNKPIQNHLMQL